MQIISNLTMITVILSGAALIREREQGTVEHLLVMQCILASPCIASAASFSAAEHGSSEAPQCGGSAGGLIGHGGPIRFDRRIELRAFLHLSSLRGAQATKQSRTVVDKAWIASLRSQ
jgi:hypothetical protein